MALTDTPCMGGSCFGGGVGPPANVFGYGRGGEIRTRDPHNPIVVRYQAALRPDCFRTGAYLTGGAVLPGPRRLSVRGCPEPLPAPSAAGGRFAGSCCCLP